MSAAHFNLDRLTAIIDRNQLSQEGTTAETMALEPLPEKLAAFGWFVLEVDGHDMDDVLTALETDPKGKPKIIIANTIKGRGIDSLADTIKSHFSHLDEAQTRQALEQIEKEELAL